MEGTGSRGPAKWEQPFILANDVMGDAIAQMINDSPVEGSQDTGEPIADSVDGTPPDSEQIHAPADTATEDVQTTEAAPTLPKFKSTEQLEKAYKELESAFTRSQQEKKEREEQNQKLIDTLSRYAPQPPATPAEPESDPNEAFGQSFVEKPYAATQDVVMQTMQSIERHKDMVMSTRDEALTEVMNAVPEELKHIVNSPEFMEKMKSEIQNDEVLRHIFENLAPLEERGKVTPDVLKYRWNKAYTFAWKATMGASVGPDLEGRLKAAVQNARDEHLSKMQSTTVQVPGATAKVSEGANGINSDDDFINGMLSRKDNFRP